MKSLNNYDCYCNKQKCIKKDTCERYYLNNDCSDTIVLEFNAFNIGECIYYEEVL
jgi:hypothetical protein